jgi:hypothetical protein
MNQLRLEQKMLQLARSPITDMKWGVPVTMYGSIASIDSFSIGHHGETDQEAPERKKSSGIFSSR